jgi:hypothetical protein
VPEKFGFGRV